MSRFPALAEPQFRRYFIGQSIALVGGFAHNVALSWLAFRLSGSTVVLGIVGFVTLAPALFVSPIAGLYADRYPRRLLLLILLGAVCVLSLLLAVLTAAGWISVGGLIAIALLRGTLFSCEIPVRHAFLSELVRDRSLLPNAVALHSSALNGARFVGPAIGGLLIGTVGEASCFVLHALTLCATLWQIWRIRTTAVRRAPSGKSFVHDYLEGWRLAFADPVVARLLLGVFVLGFAIAPYTFLMPAAVAQAYGPHPELVGWFLSSAGLGAMAAAIGLALHHGSRRLQRVATIGSVAAGAGLLVFSLSSSIVLALPAMALVGFGTIAQAAATNMTIQARVDDQQRGRVMAIYTAMFLGAVPFGSLAFGQLGDSIGATQALLAGALLALAGAAFAAARAKSAARDAAPQ
jgi:predicted MFS family arabinose efflux permease